MIQSFLVHVVLSFAWLQKTSLLHGQILGIPLNNHGLQPDILIDEEMNPSIGNLMKTIQLMSAEYKVSIDFIIHKLPLTKTANLYLFNGDQIDGIGEENPLVFIHPSPQTAIGVVSPINGTNKGYRVELGNIGHHHKLDVEQRYFKDGLYRYSISLNEQELYSTINVDARQFYNVKCYVSSPWSPRLANATIRHLSLTNFL